MTSIIKIQGWQAKWIIKHATEVCAKLSKYEVTYPHIHINIHAHQADDLAFFDVLVCMRVPHEGHSVDILLGPIAGNPVGADCGPK